MRDDHSSLRLLRRCRCRRHTWCPRGGRTAGLGARITHRLVERLLRRLDRTAVRAGHFDILALFLTRLSGRGSPFLALAPCLLSGFLLPPLLLFAFALELFFVEIDVVLFDMDDRLTEEGVGFTDESGCNLFHHSSIIG